MQTVIGKKVGYHRCPLAFKFSYILPISTFADSVALPSKNLGITSVQTRNPRPRIEGYGFGFGIASSCFNCFCPAQRMTCDSHIVAILFHCSIMNVLGGFKCPSTAL